MFGNYKTGYTYKTKELGEVSLFLPLALLTLILGAGGYMIYRRDSEDDYEDEDEDAEITSGKESINAVSKLIRRMRANPELLD